MLDIDDYVVLAARLTDLEEPSAEHLAYHPRGDCPPPPPGGVSSLDKVYFLLYSSLLYSSLTAKLTGC